MSVSRRSAGPVRQLSLQSSASSSHRPLRRQHSEEHHQERWRRRGASPELRVTANSLRTGGPVPQDPGLSPAAGHYPVLARPPPRPVKLAWGERRGAATGSDRQGVEVVAKKCLGNPRPVTAKHTANNLPTLGLDAVMYTRQQLAERLRKAWREREKSRPNLDIFLSHVTSEDCLQDTPRNTPVISVLAKPRVNLAPSGGGVGVDLEPVGAATNFSVFPSGAQISQASYVVDRSSCAVAGDTSPMDPDTAPDSSSNYDGDDRESLIISRQIVIAVSTRPNTAPVVRKTDGKTNPAPKDCVDTSKGGGPIPQKSPNEHGQGEGPGKSYEEMSAGARRFSFKNSASKAIMESFTSDSPLSPTPPSAVRPTPTMTPTVRTTPTPPPTFRPAPTPPPAFRPAPTPPPAIRPAPTSPPTGRPAPTPPPAVRPAPTQSPAVRPTPTPPPSVRPVPAPPLSVHPVPTPPPTVRSVPTPPPAVRPAPTPPLISRAVPTPPLLRALSAPAQRSPTPKGILAVVGPVRQQPLQVAVSVDLEDSGVGEEEENPWSRDRNIRSAPPRRPRLKTVSGRKKPRGWGEEENDEAAGADKREKGAGGGRRGVHRGSEIITMVSLMSPGGSDNEADGDAFFQSTTSSNVPSWFEDRNAGKSVGDIAAALTTAVTRVVCLRKTPKSVSFQQVLPLAVAAVVSVPPSIPAAAPPHQERDKRAPSGTRDEEDGSAKRKVVRIQSAPVVKQNCNVEEGHPPSKEEDTKVSNKPKVPEKTRAPADEPKVPEKTRASTEQAKQPPPVSNLAPPDPVGSTEPASVPSEPSLGQLGVESLVVPEFKSPKEKECWELYRRMCDKGVTVSYDTVLRGMLTPTEYRLRRNALLSTC